MLNSLSNYARANVKSRVVVILSILAQKHAKFRQNYFLALI